MNIDRSCNVVISGIVEDRNRDAWITTVRRALAVAAGREVQIADAFRIGGRYSEGRKRPVLVKLQSAWDRRIVVSGARRLAGDTDFRGRVYINADEPVEVRRKNMLTRLKARAERDGKTAFISLDDVLSVDGVPVFSVRSGFIHTDIAVGDTITNTNG